MSKKVSSGLLQKLQVTFFAPVFRGVGKAFYYFGKGMQGTTGSSDRVLPSPNSISIKSQFPSLANSTFIGPNTTIIGNVKLGRNSSVLFASNFKTDGSNSSIQIGDNTIIHDLVTIKAERNGSVVIGNNCFIASNAHIINSTIEDNVFVGIGAFIPEGCTLERNSYVAAGAKLQPGTVVRSNEMWAGFPAHFLRRVNKDEVEYLDDLREQNTKLSEIYLEHFNQPLRDFHNSLETSNPEGYEYNVAEAINKWTRMSEELKLPTSVEDLKGQHNRLSMHTYNSKARQPQPINYDGEKNLLPEYFNAGKDNYIKQNEIKQRLENDPSTQRVNREAFDKPRVTYKDEDFKRKF
jgi:carbonic anhydrase/acetyltransferase-like protein (isoleucine patch superfamily)